MIHVIPVITMRRLEELVDLYVHTIGERELLADVATHVIKVSPRLEISDELNIHHKIQIERPFVELVWRHLAVLWPVVVGRCDVVRYSSLQIGEDVDEGRATRDEGKKAVRLADPVQGRVLEHVVSQSPDEPQRHVVGVVPEIQGEVAFSWDMSVRYINMGHSI